MTHERGPRVSVIIPTYNRARFIAAAVDSVLRQTFRDFELIVVDDGSTDNTADIMRPFLNDPRILYIQQANRGRSAARNRAISIARGDYIAFLDSDDSYLPGKLESQVACMDRRVDVDMVYTSATCVNEAGEALHVQVYRAEREGDIYDQIAFFQPLTITLPTVMVRRAVLEQVGGFDVEMERFEDTDMWRRIAKSHRIGAMPEVTCLLTTHEDNSLANQNPQKIIDAVNYYVAKVFRDDSDKDRHVLRLGASRLYEYYGRALLSAPGYTGLGFTLIGKSIYHSPARAPAILLRGLRTLAGSWLRGLVSSRGVTQ